MNTDKIISILLIFIWAVLLAMGVLTLIQPSWLTELSHEGKNVEAISYKEAGDNLLKEGKNKEAIIQYQKALKIVPDKKDAIANLAIAHQSMRNYNEAIKYYNELLELKPEYPSIIYYNVAEIFNQQNKADKALKYYKKSAKLSYDPEKAYQKAGSIFMDKKECDSAIFYFKLALKNISTLENSYISILLKNQQHFSDSLSKYQEIGKLIAEARDNYNFNKYDYQIYNTMLNNDFNLVKTYGNIGYCYAINEQYEESMVYLKKALQLDPGFKDAQNNLRVVEQMIPKK
jgi:tetratricopeptide (TPR) repeat protein